MKLLQLFGSALIFSLFLSVGTMSWAEKNKTPDTVSTKEIISTLKAEQMQLSDEHKKWEYIEKDIEQEHKWISQYQDKLAKKIDWNKMEEKHKQFRMKYNDLLKKHSELLKEYKTIIATSKENSIPSNLLDRQQRLHSDIKIINTEHKQMIDAHKHMHHMHETMLYKTHNMHHNMNMKDINMKMKSMKSCEGNMNCKSCGANNAKEKNMNCSSCCNSK